MILTIDGNNGVSILRNIFPKAILPLLGLGKQNLKLFLLDSQQVVNLWKWRISVLNSQIKTRQGNGLDEMQTHQLYLWFYLTEVSGTIFLPMSARAQRIKIELIIEVIYMWKSVLGPQFSLNVLKQMLWIFFILNFILLYNWRLYIITTNSFICFSKETKSMITFCNERYELLNN